MNKSRGILLLLLAVCAFSALMNPDFLTPYNLQNIIRWTSLFGILSIGVAFVIITGGIDLSIGSLVGLVGCLLPLFLVQQGMGAGAALASVLAVSLLVGLGHGLLVTRLRLQPFVVTLCGLLLYRGYARYLTADQTQGFGTGFQELKQLATGKPMTLAVLAAGAGVAILTWTLVRGIRRRREGDESAIFRPAAAGSLLLAAGAAVRLGDIQPLSRILVPAPFLIMLALALLAGIFLNQTIYGRYLLALGRNREAARYSGIDTDRMVILAYVICSLMAGVGGILFALDINSIQPSGHGNFYELYAIAAAVLGGCSLRGGEGSILGVVLGAAVMRVLYNAINLLGIPTQLEFAIIGGVILAGVVGDELVRKMVARRQDTRPG
jgi:ribose transport system permease protein